MNFAKQSDMHKRRGKGNLYLALCLVALMVLVMALSLVKLRNAGPVEGFDHIVRPALEGAAE